MLKKSEKFIIEIRILIKQLNDEKILKLREELNIAIS